MTINQNRSTDNVTFIKIIQFLLSYLLLQYNIINVIILSLYLILCTSRTEMAIYYKLSFGRLVLFNRSSHLKHITSSFIGFCFLCQNDKGGLCSKSGFRLGPFLRLFASSCALAVIMLSMLRRSYLPSRFTDGDLFRRTEHEPCK